MLNAPRTIFPFVYSAFFMFSLLLSGCALHRSTADNQQLSAAPIVPIEEPVQSPPPPADSSTIDLNAGASGGVVKEQASAGYRKGILALLNNHPGESGVYVLEKGEESLLARAWLVDHAVERLDVQYYIWSADNVGILATEAILRAAERGVRVRILVDDINTRAPNDAMLALNAHQNIEIKIYNPKISVGTPLHKKVSNILGDFRGVNQRMHNKGIIVDGLVGITGGRNMADEYYDFDHFHNFRDRDILLLGPVVEGMQDSFDAFWNFPLSVNVDELLADDVGDLSVEKVAETYRGLHAYAANPTNFAPEVRLALEKIPEKFAPLLSNMDWGTATFLSDDPGKNNGEQGLEGGGRITSQLIAELEQASQRITVQSPYVVLPEGGIELFRKIIARGVTVRISTNSLASIDSAATFSGYHKQRGELLKAGVQIFEFRPDPAIARELIERYQVLAKEAPVFGLHAKTLVVDGKTLFIGTFNLDARSAHLNTEVGVLIHNQALAARVESSIATDMLSENSWDASKDNPDIHAGVGRRMALWLWKLLPLDPLL